MDIDVSLYLAVSIAIVISLAIASAAFRWPDRAFERSAIAAACALILPFVVAFAATPFLGAGAGMGVALILYAMSAFILLAAISASLGAAARYGWTAIQDRHD
jgi:uncharacterized membrane protein YozB (DUF420 family)